MSTHLGPLSTISYKYFSNGPIRFKAKLNSPIRVRFIRRSTSHTLGKQLRLIREFQTDIDEFDSKVFILSKMN